MATEEDQQTIADTIQQIDLNAPNAAVSAVYSMQNGDALALSTALKGLVPSASFVADATGRSLLVLASPDEQALIKKTVDQWSQDSSRALLPKVYTMQSGEPQAAVTVLQKLLPGATFAVDLSSRSIAATATLEQHVLIAQTVMELDNAGGELGKTELRSYSLNKASVEPLTAALQSIFKGDTQVSFASDKTSNSIIAVARPRQHEMIAGLISATDATAEKSTLNESLEIYPLANQDGKTLTESLSKLFENAKPKPQISFDSGGQQVLAIATPKQHEQIRSTISQLHNEIQDFELFHLRQIDPTTAQSAIDGMFREEPRKSAPSVDVDYDNQTLLIRATPVQLLKIRELLVKLGETDAGLVGGMPKSNLLRVVPVETNVNRVLEQLEKIWPKLQENELRVIRPEGPKPTTKPDGEKSREPEPSSGNPSQSSVDPHSTQYRVSVPAARQLLYDARVSTNPLQDENAAPKQSDKPAILVIPGNRQLTLASSDAQVLDIAEQVIRAISGPLGNNQNMGNFQTFLLRNAGAEQIKSILQELFEDMPTRQRLSSIPLLVTADERLNLVVVHGSRADREIIGSLIEVLDSPDVTDALSINQPIIVPVRNTDADRLMAILNNVYRSQLSSGGGRKQVPIPEGLPLQLASLLQQVNVSTSGPVLTLGVDTVTNSIIVLAPPQLREQVKATISQLDHSVETEPGEQIQIIQLQKTSTVRIQRALDAFFKSKK